MSSRKVFLSVIFFLVTAGWAANHFAAVLVVLKERANLETLLVNGAYVARVLSEFERGAVD